MSISSLYPINLQSHIKKAKSKELTKELFRLRNLSLRPCLCDLDEYGIWRYAADLYEGKFYKTLSNHTPFRVDKVVRDGSYMQTEKKKYFISKQNIEDVWTKLRHGERISRAELEASGIKNSSQVVTLLMLLPGVNCTRSPITLRFAPKKPTFKLTIT